MNPLKTPLCWLSQSKNRKTLAQTGGGLVIAAGCLWLAYARFSEKPTDAQVPTISASEGNITATGNGSETAALALNASIAAENLNIEMTLEQFEAGLKLKEQDFRAELAQTSIVDKEKVDLLEKQIAETQTRLKNPEKGLEDYKAKLAQAYRAFDGLKPEFPPEQIRQAQDALTKGQTADAENLFTVALTQGLENAAEAAYQLGELAYCRIDFEAADRYYRKAMDLQPDNPLYINAAGLIAYTLGHYYEAEPLFQQALAIREKAIGPDHPGLANNLFGLAEIYRAQGQYVKAEPLLQRALAIQEKVLGPDHPDMAPSLNNLGWLYQAEGQYGKAEPLYRQSLAIRRKVLGLEHPDVAQSLNNLAALYRSEGLYIKAEPLYRRALAILERALGPGHPDLAQSLNNLAVLYQAQGNYKKAKPLLQRALAISEKALGPDHPDVAKSLNNLAVLYRADRQYGKAEPLLQRALAIREKALGPDHPDVAISLNNFAALYFAQGQYGKAEPLLQRALSIFEKALGPDHPELAKSLDNLAALYGAQGQYGKIVPLYQRTLAIRQKTQVGPGHPDVANSLNSFAAQKRTKGGKENISSAHKKRPKY